MRPAVVYLVSMVADWYGAMSHFIPGWWRRTALGRRWCPHPVVWWTSASCS
jgi:hypothetical protein